MSRTRLDDELVRRGFYGSRARARDAVLRGRVMVDGSPATKPAQAVSHATALAVSDEGQGYVSRAALKLKHGLAQFGVPVQGRRALDIGASTGGFTQVLLEEGAAHVTAIDVGHGQLNPAIAADPRVTFIEGLNVRDLAPAHVAGAIELIVCDVSFISLTLALPPALALAAPGAHLVALVKPQFEAGRAAIGKGGLVTDPAVHAEVCAKVQALLEDCGWHVLGLADSPIAGGDGNREFLIAAVNG